MEEAPENGKESSNSAHAKWMNEWILPVACNILQYTEYYVRISTMYISHHKMNSPAVTIIMLYCLSAMFNTVEKTNSITYEVAPITKPSFWKITVFILYLKNNFCLVKTSYQVRTSCFLSVLNIFSSIISQNIFCFCNKYIGTYIKNVWGSKFCISI